MGLQIKHDDGDNTEQDLSTMNWQDSSTAREAAGEKLEVEFNPEQQFDTFKVPEGVEMDRRELTQGLNPGLHIDPPNETKSKLIRIGITIGVILVLILMVKLIFFPAPKDLTADRGLDDKQLASKYGINFEREEGMDRYVPQWTEGRTVTVNKGKDLCTIYIDGKYVGFHFDTKRWTFGGLSIGDPEIHMFEQITFEYDKDYNIINDIAEGNSCADYFYNKKTNECLVVTVSDKSNRIVAITYYNDAKLILEGLSGVDD